MAWLIVSPIRGTINRRPRFAGRGDFVWSAAHPGRETEQ